MPPQQPRSYRGTDFDDDKMPVSLVEKKSVVKYQIECCPYSVCNEVNVSLIKLIRG